MNPVRTSTQIDNITIVDAHGNASREFNEIDLLDIMSVLWRAKKSIMACVLVSALAGYIILLCLPQKWTSDAIITLVDLTQLNTLQLSLAEMQSLGVEYHIDREEMFYLLIRKFQSQQTIKEYVASNLEQIKQLMTGSKKKDNLNEIVGMVSEKMKSFDTHEKKDEREPLYRSWILRFTGPDAQSAQRVLSSYIDFVVDKVDKQILDEIRNALELKTETVKKKLEASLEQLQNNHDATIQRLNYALQIAKAANITEPVYSKGKEINDDPDFSVVLGVNGIASKLEIERQMKDLTSLSPDIKNSECRLKKLSSLRVKNFSIPVLSYQQSPSYPIKQDAPQMYLVLILSAILGLLVGCAGALLRNEIKNRNKENQAA